MGFRCVEVRGLVEALACKAEMFFFSLRHFGHLPQNRIKTRRRDSIRQVYTFSDIMTEST